MVLFISGSGWKRCAGLLALAAAMGAILPPRSHALPTGAQIAAGNVAISQAGSTLNLAQSSPAAIVNWQSFGIAPDERVRVFQPGADAAMLARVTGGDPSRLLGALQADGKLFLINPQGILVGPGATIDTAGFMASTLDVADADFLKGAALTFKGDSAAGVVNLGTITAHEGNVLLLAHTVKNAGEISAPKGTAGLAAGSEVYLASADAPTFVIRTNLPGLPTAASVKVGVENTGVIAAAQAELKAAGGSLYDLAVNQSGFVRATGVERRDGRVILTADGGTVGVSGTVTARNADGAGGEILVGGDYQGKNPAVPNAARTVVTATALLDASAMQESESRIQNPESKIPIANSESQTPNPKLSATGNGGKVIVWADEATRFLGTIEARGGAQGGDGGFAEVSGKRWLDFSPTVSVDLSSPAGNRGTLLLDPDALVVSAAADSNTSTSGTNPFVFGAASEPANLNTATLQNQLATTNVTLDTSNSAGDVTFAAPVAWSSSSTLRVNAGNNINVDANITGGAGSTLALYAGKAGFDITQGPNITQGKINQAAGSTITVGTLTAGLNAAAAVPNNNGTQAGDFDFAGVLHVGTLQADLAGRFGSLHATNAANAIGTLKTTGTGGDLAEIDVVDGAGDLDVQIALANSDAFQVRAVTPGTLTLKAGTAMSFSGQADVILASTGGNLVNAAGAAAIGTNGRFLIYSGLSGATVKDGLVGTEEFSRTYAGNPPSDYFGDTTSRFLYRTAGAGLPQLTYRAGDALRLYGDANPAFGFTVSGEQPGLPVATLVTGAPALSTTATAATGVGMYTINIGQGTLASSSYDFNFAAGTLTINAAPLTLFVQNASRLYGDANPAFSLGATGLRNGDTLAALGTFAFSTTATATSNVGTYAVSASHTGGGTGNYTIAAFDAGMLTIAPAPLTVTAPSFTRVYGQDTTVDLNAVTYAGLKNGFDALTSLSVTTTPAGSGVGAYAVTPSGTSTNYAPIFVPGTLTITPAALTIRADDLTRAYGDPNPAFTATTTGLVNGDTAATAYTGLTLTTAATSASNVGAYGIVTGGATSANYQLEFVDGTLAIDRAVLNATVADASRTYTQGNPMFALAGVMGFRNGDTASVLNGLAFSTTAGAGSVPGGYAINASATAQNYTVNVTSGTLTVTKAPATFAFGTYGRVYGDAPLAFTPMLSGFLAADEAQARGVWGASLTDAVTLGAGSHAIEVAVRNASLASFYSQFYDIAFTAGTLTVAKASLQLAARNVTTTFGSGGSTNGFDVLGLRNGDPASVVSGAVLNSFTLFSSAPAGTYPITFASAGTAANYSITTVDGTMTVKRLPLTYQGPTLTTYEGTIPPLDPPQQRLVDGGPQFVVRGSIPFATGGVKAGEVIPIDLRLETASSEVRAQVLRDYELTFLPGELIVGTDPGTLTVTLGKTITIDPSLLKLKEKETIWVSITPDYSKPLGVEDFAGLITDNPARLIATIKSFWNSDVYLSDLTDDERRILDDFVLGRTTAEQLAEMLRKNPKVQEVLMPVFASLAMDLMTNGGANTVAEKRFVYFMNEAAAQQRQALAAQATERYNAWVKDEESRSTGPGGTSTLYAAYTMNLMPDVVTGAQTDILGILLGVGAGTGAAGGGTVAAMGKVPFVMKTIFPKLGKMAAEKMATRALALAGPIGLVIEIAVTVTEIAINAIAESDRHRVEYERVLARAEESKHKLGSPKYDHFELKPPQNDEDRAEVMTSFVQVFSGVFGGN